MKTVSLLVPVYNEEDSLQILYDRLLLLINTNINYHWEILFVNDGSRDESLKIMSLLRANDSRINFIDLSRNFGKEVAMLAGFDYVKGDCVIILDADLQHPPEFITEMLMWWEKGFDDVYAKRENRPGESYIRRKLSGLFYAGLKKISDIDIIPDVGDFRLLDRVCIQALRSIRESQRYTKGMYSWIGFNKKEIVYRQSERAAGVSKWSFFKLFNLALDGITSSTTSPLRISSIIGIIVSLSAFSYLLFVLIKYMMFGEAVQGYPTLITLILFLGGVQLLSLGVIGEYLGRVFYETKKRPVYFLKSYNGEKC
jgi:glycosyltransferase involved in cell wall biosynthesis